MPVRTVNAYESNKVHDKRLSEVWTMPLARTCMYTFQQYVEEQGWLVTLNVLLSISEWWVIPAESSLLLLVPRHRRMHSRKKI